MNRERVFHFGMFVGVMIGISIATGAYVLLAEKEEEPTCEDLRTEVWAFQQCLKFQPSCHVSGPESFARYSKIKDLVAETCPESADDLQSEIK